VSDAVAVFMFIGVIAYAIFGGADFGAGFWDLTAGGAARGRRPRHLVDVSIGPVWESNHIWLIYCLVFLWSAFPRAFFAITTTLYIPLGLAALGIVLRGSGFAFRKASLRTPEQRVYGAAFAASSVVTPYFLGTVVGAIASGRVPTRGYGDAIDSWNNATSVLGGVLAILVCAYQAAVYLTESARAGRDRGLVDYFRLRALATALVTGAVSIGGIFVLREDAHRLFHQLMRDGLALLIVAALLGIAGVVQLVRRRYRGLRALASLAVAAVVIGWGVSQYPFLLGTHLRLSDAVSPDSTLWVLIGVAGVAVLLIAPSLGLLFLLAEQGRVRADGDA
jgi:cytochrome bd ubiquinol oxidase subunit II